MKTLGPKFTVSNNNRTADAYDRNSHYTVELYDSRIWQGVRITLTEEEARKLSVEYIEAKPTI